MKDLPINGKLEEVLKEDTNWAEGEAKLIGEGADEGADEDAEETSLGVLKALCRSCSLRRVALTSLSQLSYTSAILDHQYPSTRSKVFNDMLQS